MIQTMMLTSIEQRIFLRLIIQGRDSWDKQSLFQIQKWIGAEMSCAGQVPDMEWPVTCIGCGAKAHFELLPYPVIIERCPSCNPKPLKLFSGERVWPGLAKLFYIEAAIHFPTIRERNAAIHEAMQR
jgi:hypothetical protein